MLLLVILGPVLGGCVHLVRMGLPAIRKNVSVTSLARLLPAPSTGTAG